MSSRTTHTTVTFEHPFSLKGLDGPQAPGTFDVQTDDELMEGVSFPAYRRTATAISIPVPHGGAGSFQTIATDPQELDSALMADRARSVEQKAAPPTSDDRGGSTKSGQTDESRRFRWNPFASRLK